MELVNRKVLRSQITKVTNQAAEILKENTLPSAYDSANDIVEEDLVVIMERIKSLYSNLLSANREAAVLVQESNYEKECELIAEYNDKAVAVIARIEKRILSLQQLKQIAGIAHPIVAEPPRQTENRQQQQVRLPPLELLKFDGSVKKWLPFWEQFRTVVHENHNLSPSDKFNYLKNSLLGAAKNTIGGFTPTEACYIDAINLLKEQYDDKEKIVEDSMNQLMSLPTVKSRDDMVGMRKLYNAICSSMRSLSALGVAADQYNIMLKSIIMRSLPTELKLEYHRRYTHINSNNQGADAEPDTEGEENENISVSDGASVVSCCADGDEQLQRILKFIKLEVVALEKVGELERGERYTSSSHKQLTKSNMCTAAGLLTSSKESQSNVGQRECFFCGSKNHNMAACRDDTISLAKKKDILKKYGCCFKCTKRYHSAKNCKVFLKCMVCNGRHAVSMCDPEFVRQKKQQDYTPASSYQNASTSNETTGLFATTSVQTNKIYLQTACAYVSSPSGKSELFVRLVLDGGSQLTFIKEDFSRALNLPIVGTHRLSIIPFGSNKKSPIRVCNTVRLKIKGQYYNNTMFIEAIEVPDICVDVLSTPNSNNPSFQNLLLADARVKNMRPLPGINLLIGADNYWLFVNGEFQRLTDNLTAVNTCLGWTLHGPANSNDSSTYQSTSLCSFVDFDDDQVNGCNLWKLETVGITNEEKSNERFAEDFIKENIRRLGDRFEVSLPWKSDFNLGDNRAIAVGRLKNLIKRLSREENKLKEYDTALKEYLTFGFAEEVPNCESKRVYYLPHRAVYRQDKLTSKLRIVFDASSHEVDKDSLNDCLWAGENLYTDLYSILLNFRLGKIALTADIEKAFLQISLDKRDRDSHRFLWIKNNEESAVEVNDFQEYRMTSLTFGITSSPFILSATLRKHFESFKDVYTKTYYLIKDSFYVDDLVLSVNSEETAAMVYNETLCIMKAAGMNIRKWTTNSHSLRSKLQNDDKGYENFTSVKTLGIIWWLELDDIGVDLQPAITYHVAEKIGSKRSVLKMISRIYDPLGILGPFTVNMKILFQLIWKLKLDWDSILPDELHNQWCQWCEGLSNLKNFSLPRYVFHNTDDSADDEITLHIFSDASPSAYGVVAYIRKRSPTGLIHCQFLCSRNRVAPLKDDGSKELTIPKLELTAALLAARLHVYLNKKLSTKIAKTYIWSDSKISLFWISGDISKQKPYVRNRVKEITKICTGVIWLYCPGMMNPADLLTRGVSASILLKSLLWKNGPEFLHKEQAEWPNDADFRQVDSLEAVNLLVNLEENLHYRAPIIDVKRFSNYRRFLRITAYVLRFAHNIKSRNVKLTGYISISELKRSEIYWLRYVQWQSYEAEIQALLNQRQINCSSKISTFTPFLDEQGLLRVGGRLQMADENFDVIHPIILPKEAVINMMLIMDVHIKLYHSGVNAIFTRLRQRFWLVKGRQLIKRIIKTCVECKRMHAKAATEPFAPMPKERITVAKPFETTGIDFAGPLYIKSDVSSEKTSKVYIMLLTCAVVRAVHLELVPNLTTESCISALQRFIARRGVPAVMYSDNAKTFKRAALELKALGDVLKAPDLHNFALHQGIEWRFIVERAAWWGGWWERLVRSVKENLKIVLKRNLLTFDQLQTLLVEIESTINSRPITYISDSPSDLQPLSPANFLISSSLFSLPTIGNHFNHNFTNADLIQVWVRRQKSIQKFRKRWTTDYLQLLRSVHCSPRRFSSNIKVDDVVLIHDEGLPRTLWKLGRITTIYPGRDGKVRACEVRTSDQKTLRRPVQLIYPLEIQ